MKVLLLGHACSPQRGTELAFTWNWAWHLSQQHQVWVITHPQERQAIEEFLAANPNPDLHFVWVTIPNWLDTWDPSDPNSSVRLHYIVWQKFALREANRLHRQVGFDIAHHVSWGTVSEPPPFWRLPVPFVWGPVGGGQVAPAAFKRYFGAAWRREVLRAARMWCLPYRPALRAAIRRSALILSTNRETDSMLRKAGAGLVAPFLDSGLRDDFVSPEPVLRRAGTLLKLLWVGQLEARKCLPLALEALAQAKDVPARLLVAGRGTLREKWEEIAERLGISDRVVFLGHVPYGQMPALYHSSDAFIFTSLRDAFGSQVLEAMGSGLPIIGLDHQGLGAFVPPEAGIKVPVTNPEGTVTALANAIRRLANSPEESGRMGRAAWDFANTQRWQRRAKVMSAFYEDIIRNHGLSRVNAREGLPQHFAVS